MNFFSDNENFERGPPRHAGGNGNQGINFVWPKQEVQDICGHTALRAKIKVDLHVNERQKI